MHMSTYKVSKSQPYRYAQDNLIGKEEITYNLVKRVSASVLRRDLYVCCYLSLIETIA